MIKLARQSLHAILFGGSERADRLRLMVLIGAVSSALILLAALLVNWVRSGALQEELHNGAQQLQLYAAYLEGELARYEALPALLATNQRVIKVLQQPDNFSARQALNEYFEQSASSTGALDIYLMDGEGLTLASSNWQSERGFIGLNFGFRPYFQQAMSGQLGRYYALGTTSKVRGYYYAYPVSILGQVEGVVVVKMDVGVIESQWRGVEGALLVSDPQGVIFISTLPQWRYRSIHPLTEQQRQTLAETSRYPGIEHQALNSRKRATFDQAELVLLEEPALHGRFMRHDYQMPTLGWTTHLLRPMQSVDRRVQDALLIAFSAFVVFALALAVALQRRLRRMERRRAEDQARQALERAHNQLEIRVSERTADLRREFEERCRAERALRKTQDELIQAAKLATLGQMSASINHELNQPLTAIRSFADNARLLLQHQRYPDVAENMRQIIQLVDRMAQISSQLKLFSRKSSGQRTPVSLANELELALKILDREICAAGVKIDVAVADHRVLADATRLEQVLVNLIGNAVNALQAIDQAAIQIEARTVGDQLEIDVRDNGPGIPQEHLEQIFDPFFTTRKSGLGLGLAISQQIVENMGGQLAVHNASEGGAVFTVTLDRVVEKSHASIPISQ